MSTRIERAEDALMARVGANIVRMRQARGWTLAELSERSGLFWRHLQKIEAGELNATLATLAKLSSAFKVEAAAILALAPEPPEETRPRARRGARGRARRARR